MPFVLMIPNEYGYVLLAATSTFFLNLFHVGNTGAYRKQSGISYPNAYATEQQAKDKVEAFQFNCAQRAHANFTEHHLAAVGSLLIGGVKYPLLAAVFGFGWTLSRVAYMVGYSRSSQESKGKGRYKGSAFWLFEVGLISLATVTGVQIAIGTGT